MGPCTDLLLGGAVCSVDFDETGDLQLHGSLGFPFEQVHPRNGFTLVVMICCLGPSERQNFCFLVPD